MNNTLGLTWNVDRQICEITEADDTLATRLQNAVLISLFSDARADADEEPQPQNRKGWWGDYFLPTDESIGSKLWLTRRSKLIAGDENAIRDYTQHALEWMVTDELVAAVTVTAERQSNQLLALLITLTLDDGDSLTMQIDRDYASTGTD